MSQTSSGLPNTSIAIMPLKIKPILSEEARLRRHLRDTLEDQPSNLPRFDDVRLLGTHPSYHQPRQQLTTADDLCFLLRSPLFLHAISPRLAPSPTSTPCPPTPVSIDGDTSGFNILHLEIRIIYSDSSWATQLCHDNAVLLESRELNVEQEQGFEQSFHWFCEEASFLAYEFKAREHAFAVRMGNAVDTAPLKRDTVLGNDGWPMPAKSKGKGKRKALKLLVRLRSTGRGRAGVWCMQ